MDLKRLLNSTSGVVCGGHHNHVIHPVRKEFPKEDDNDYYDDFWGESVLEGASAPDQKGLDRRESSEGSKLFSNVNKKPSIKFTDAMKVGLQLSFDESVESASASGSYALMKENSIRSTDSGSDSASA